MRPAQLSVVGRPRHWTLSVIENVPTLEGPHHIVVSHNLQLTGANTTKGIETCGVLCGKLMRNALAITHSPRRPNSGLQDCHTENEKHSPQAEWLGLLTPGCLQTQATQMAFYPVCTFTTPIKWCFQNPWQLSALPSSRKLDKWILQLAHCSRQEIPCCGQRGFHPGLRNHVCLHLSTFTVKYRIRMRWPPQTFNKQQSRCWEGAHWVRAFDTKTNSPSSLPGIHVVEGENQLPPICPLSSTCALWYVCTPLNK